MEEEKKKKKKERKEEIRWFREHACFPLFICDDGYVDHFLSL